jgi:hypothetical protein
MMDGMLSISLLYFLFKMWDMKEVWNGAVYMFSGLSLIPGCSPFRETFLGVFFFATKSMGCQEHCRRTSKKHRVAYKGSQFRMDSIRFPVSLIVHFLFFYCPQIYCNLDLQYHNFVNAILSFVSL